MHVTLRHWSSAGAYVWRLHIAVRSSRSSQLHLSFSARLKRPTQFWCSSTSNSSSYCQHSHLNVCAASPRDQSNQDSATVDAMDLQSLERLREAANEFPPPPGAKFSYGTSGFRTTATVLESTLFRSGVVAALRSLSTGRATGLMVSASHNHVADNGVKLVDPDGGMLVMDWERYAEMLANCPDADSFVHGVGDVSKKEGVRTFNGGKVFIAMDTRPSGPKLLQASKKGIGAVPGVVAVERGVLTTPQLHWMVREHNLGRGDSEKQYFETLSNAFRTLMNLQPSGAPVTKRVLYVDGANGVGAIKLVDLESHLGDLKLRVRNTGLSGPGILNDHVGADFVQKEKVLPQCFDSVKDEGLRCVSVDGDADRLVYFYYGYANGGTDHPRLRLLDGDKIMALFSTFVKEQLAILSPAAAAPAHESADGAASEFGSVSLAAVQTAYANGASTKYLEKLGIDVIVTKTGVKHVHRKAEAYDIGFYFEANGHGTILLKGSFVERLKHAIKAQNLSGEVAKAVQRLLAVSEMVNQAAGDALSGILMVELILEYKGWSIQDWDSIYEDYPSRQLKVKVADRSMISTSATETRVTNLVELQEAIDAETGGGFGMHSSFPSILKAIFHLSIVWEAVHGVDVKYEGGRSFARPSGTEDIVRIYSEASSQAAADTLAMRVRALVHKHARGVGPPPSLQTL